MVCLRWARICACLGSVALGACGDDADPGGGGTNTTTGSGPTTFATFSTTVPPVTTGSSSADTGSDSSGSGSDSDASSGSQGDSSSSTDSGLCPNTHVCTLEAPEGWSGPVAIHSAATGDAKNPEPPECGRLYPNAVESGFEGLEAEAATCGCECGPANGSACDSSTTLRYWADDATCSETTPQAVTIFGSACNALPDFEGNGHYTVEPLPAVGGACAPTTESVVEPAAWADVSVACGGGSVIEDAGCAEGRVCAPLPESEDAALCIWQDGEHACPDDFDTQRVLFGDFDDTRGCETCSCTAPIGLCDAATVSLWNGPTCLVPAAGVVTANAECVQTGTATSARAASLNAGSPTAFCSPSEPAPSGEAVGSDPVTICCTDAG